MYDIWIGDDPMPSCDNCMEGYHDLCEDLLFSERYGVYACGCENPEHEDS